MRSIVVRRLAAVALLVVLGTPSIFAASKDPDRSRSWGERVKQIIVRVLDDFRLSGPPG